MKRLVAALTIALALSQQTAHADTETTKVMNRDNARCQFVETILERGGLSPREARIMAALHCQKIGGRWYSDLVYAA